jgi:hypothetical protein
VFLILQAWEDFEEFVDDLYFPADAIASDVSLDGVVGNLFGAESDYVVICNSLFWLFVNIINGSASPFCLYLCGVAISL